MPMFVFMWSNQAEISKGSCCLGTPRITKSVPIQPDVDCKTIDMFGNRHIGVIRQSPSVPRFITLFCVIAVSLRQSYRVLKNSWAIRRRSILCATSIPIRVVPEVAIAIPAVGQFPERGKRYVTIDDLVCRAPAMRKSRAPVLRADRGLQAPETEVVAELFHPQPE